MQEIQTNNIFYPLTKVNENTFIEGYWMTGYWCEEDKRWIEEKDNIDMIYPKPESSSESISEEFINKLKQLFNAEFTHSNIKCSSFMGFSECRLCGFNNGNSEYKLKNQDNITFTVPEGIIHYYIEHKVQPSKEFYDFVMNFNLTWSEYNNLENDSSKLFRYYENLIKNNGDKNLIKNIEKKLFNDNINSIMIGMSGLKFTK